MGSTNFHAKVGALADRNFALFFLGYSVSLIGGGMVPVALTFAILGLGYGASGVGLVLAAEALTMIALLLIGGTIADRFPRKLVMVTADGARCIAQLLLAALLLGSHPPLWLIMVLSVVLGAGQAFFGPALTGLVPETASAGNLQNANALIGLSKWAGQVLGPALAGLLVATGGAHWAILIDALTYAVGAACLFGLRLPEAPEQTQSEPFLRHLRLGWTEFAAQAWLWIIVVQFGFYRMLVVAPVMVLGALIAEQQLGGASAWGFVLSGEGVGAVIGGLVMIRFRPQYPLIWATIGTLSGLPFVLLLAWVGPLWLIILAAAWWGAGLAIFTVLFDTTMQERIPAQALSRVSSYDWLGSYALAPIGFAFVGPLAGVIGIEHTLMASAVWLLAASSLVLAQPAIRSLKSGIGPNRFSTAAEI